MMLHLTLRSRLENFITLFSFPIWAFNMMYSAPFRARFCSLLQLARQTGGIIPRIYIPYLITFITSSYRSSVSSIFSSDPLRKLHNASPRQTSHSQQRFWPAPKKGCFRSCYLRPRSHLLFPRPSPLQQGSLKYRLLPGTGLLETAHYAATSHIDNWTPDGRRHEALGSVEKLPHKS